MLLDQVLPSWDVASRHTTWIAAPSERVYHAVRTVDLGRPWLVRLLLGLRAVPARMGAAFRGRSGPSATGGHRPVRGLPFTVVMEEPGVELVLGIVGRFWLPGGGLVASSARQFQQPPPPGLAQAVWNFRVEPRGGGTQLSTETRVRCADESTRRSFLRYWAIVRFGSGLTRRSMLRLIRRTAEKGTAS